MFNWADYTIIAIIVISTLISLMRGFVREALSLITWVAAFIVAFKFCDRVAALFINYIQTPNFRVALGFAILFIIVLILGGLLGFLITQLIVKTGLTGTDRLLGTVFGIIRGVLLVAVILLLINVDQKKPADWWQHSYFIPYFKELVAYLHSFLPAKISALTAHTKATFAAAPAIAKPATVVSAKATTAAIPTKPIAAKVIG
ncbi:MAG: CvpA family protein [Gammaproteobacteria bacterium]|nr:CvpA family protein [Gammaproteobacteria bacterium]